MMTNEPVLTLNTISDFGENLPATTTRVEASSDSGPGEQPTPVDRWVLQKVLDYLGQPPIRIVLWNGEEFGSTRETPVGRILIHSRAALRRLLLRPRIEFGETFRDGLLEVDGSLTQVLVAMFRSVVKRPRRGLLGRILSVGAVRHRSHSVHDSRDNVHHHYDIGNDFYWLWLDDQLLYTCAYYSRPDMTLEQAQIAKMDHICRKLQLQPGQRVVEAGCGWGALALHMAKHFGVQVRAFNLSREQIAYARERAGEEELDDRLEFVEDDYRNISGQYDAFVSVGMLEHVGLANYEMLGDLISRVLTPSGRGLIHTIGRNVPRALDPWIAKRIFPGAYPPTLREMMDIFEPSGLSVLDVENLRLHYAQTLSHWLERYERNADAIIRMFDAEFYRTWRLYLAGSEATFLIGDLQLFQVVFAREADNSVPWTREHQYG
jgi:cyclopropane-fatty-acyl-phospholipid synthase